MSSNKNSSRNNSLSSNKAKKVISNQKKNFQSSKQPNENEITNSKHTKFSEKIFKTNYMKNFIYEGSSEYKCKCKYCKDPLHKTQDLELLVDSVYMHIKSEKHRISTPAEEEDLLTELKEKIDKANVKVPKGIQTHEDRKESESKNFLEFIGFMIKEKLSYSQIQRIGEFLKEMYKENQLKFFKESTFDRELISLISKDCFGQNLIEQLKKDLTSYKYSLSLDNTTIASENLCALKAKYIETNEGKTRVQNKIVGLYKLRESSSGETMFEVLKQKLFFNEEIKNNLTGIVTDHASSLIGPETGLIVRLKEALEPRFIFTLKDPCHALNIVAKNSLDILPSEIMATILELSAHFSYPQRVAALYAVQEKNNLPLLRPKKYGKTRWLSLNDSIERMIEIWDSLKIYMTEQNLCPSIKAMLNNEKFYLQICFLCNILKRINKYNIILQNHSLPIGDLKITIDECYDSVSYLVLKPDRMEVARGKRLTLNWEHLEVQKEWFKDTQRFVSDLVTEIDPKRLRSLKSLTFQEQENFMLIFYKFIGKVLNLLGEKLPLDDEVIDMLEFVDLNQDFGLIKDKLLSFIKRFSILKEDLIPDVVEELIALKTKKYSTFKEQARNSIELWDIIEKNGFILLPYIARIAQSLPTSSATIEQSFSILKLVKSQIRHNLSEENLTSDLLIAQEYKEALRIKIDESLVQVYSQIKTSLNERKKGINHFDRSQSVKGSVPDDNGNYLRSK